MTKIEKKSLDFRGAMRVLKKIKHLYFIHIFEMCLLKFGALVSIAEHLKKVNML